MQRLLFVSLFCVLTSANGPVKVEIGQDAVLPCSPSTKENIQSSVFNWKKGDQEVFLFNGGQYHGNGLTGQDKQFESRVSHFNEELKNGNASITIRKTKMADRGVYTCILPRLKPPQQFIIELVVECILKDRTEEEPGACGEPSVTLLDQTSDQAVLQCVVKGASPKPTVEWRDSSGNILKDDKRVTKNKNDSYDIILNKTVTKSDTYSCVVTQDDICHQINSSIHIYIHGSGSWTGWIVFSILFSLSVFVNVVVAVFYIWRRCRKNGNATPQNTRQAGSPPETVNLNLKT